MSRGERERLTDIKEAVAAIREHVDRGRSEFSSLDDPLVHDALLYQFVVIGEAVKNLTGATRARAPEIPWDDVAGLRDLIAHEYFRIEMDRVLAIVDRDLSPLETAIDRLLSEHA